jgi:hypothetical protein
MSLEALKAAIDNQKKLADGADALAESGVFKKLPDVAPKSAPRVIVAEAHDEKGQLISLGEYGGTATVEKLREMEQKVILSTRQVIGKVVAIQRDSLNAQAKLFRR